MIISSDFGTPLPRTSFAQITQALSFSGKDANDDLDSYFDDMQVRIVYDTRIFPSASASFLETTTHCNPHN